MVGFPALVDDASIYYGTSNVNRGLPGYEELYEEEQEAMLCKAVEFQGLLS
jgi:hypothetical protein